MSTIGWYSLANDARNVKKALEKEGFYVFVDIANDEKVYPYKVMIAIDDKDTMKSVNKVVQKMKTRNSL